MANVDIRLGHKNTTWFTTNSTLVLKDGQMVVCSDGANQGKYKIGDGVTQLSALTFYGGSGYAFTGLTSQYTRGDGTYATFPTNISSFSNDSGYLTSSAIGVTVQGYSASTTLLGNTTTGSGSSIVLGTSPTITTPSISGFTSFTSSGTPSSGEPNYFTSTITAPIGNQYNIRSTYTINSSSNNSSYRIGGILGETYIHASNSGQLGWAVGTYGYIQNYGSGVITRAIGSFNIVANRSTGTISNTYGGYFKTENDTTGTLTFNAGVYIDTPSNFGTITTNNGIYIAAQSGIGTTNYALYSVGASDSSYFAGSVTINTSLTSTTVTNTPVLVGTTTSGITYKSTTGTGAATDAAHLFVGGSNGATEIIRFLNNGNIRIPKSRVIQGLDSAGTYRDLFTWSSGDNISINGRPGVTDIEINPTSGGIGLAVKSNGDGGIGVATPAARWHVIKTTEQLRLGYDASNYISETVSSLGNITYNNVTSTQTAGANLSNYKWNGITKTWAAGTLATQYFNYFSANTVAFASASTATNVYGLYVEAATAGANAAITNNWSLGTNGNLLSQGSLVSSSPSGGVGYFTGAGATVTQKISRTTGVTINNVCGSITLVSAAGTATWQSFTVTNSRVTATDVIIVNQGTGTDLYQIFVTNVAHGSFQITFATTGGTTTEQPVFNFSIIKAVTA